MCGIWGYFSKHQYLSHSDKLDLLKGFYNVQDRGPDRSELIDSANPIPFLLGFHRLAIMDISTNGDQPFRMEYKGRTIYSICNGEIFNFRQLAKEHEIELQTNSDCEILHLLYIKYGFEQTLKMLVGEFAIVIVDVDNASQTMEVYFGRDALGVRPMYLGEDENGLCFSSTLNGFVTDEKHLTRWSKTLNKRIPDTKQLIKHGIRQFQPGHFLKMSMGKGYFEKELVSYYSYEFNEFKIYQLEEALQKVKESLVESVVCRLASDRPLGCLLSGGLDSSLVVAIASRYLRSIGKRLRTFSIGMPGSTDKEYAEMVSRHCDTDHTHIELQEKDFLDKIPEVIEKLGSFCTTSVRATTGQLLACEYIAKTTNITVLLIGDGADELCGGYLYFHKAPSPSEFHDENRRLLKNIYMYDGQRADRGVSSCGLEARVPFLDHRFVNLYMSIDPKLRMPTQGLEKWLLRKAFSDDNYLPKEVLYRRKEAFSDGVSGKKRSWYEIIQEQVDISISDEEYYEEIASIQHCKPVSKESLHYRRIFHDIFGYGDIGNVVTHLWLPKKEWVGNVTEASARALTDLYNDVDIDLHAEPEKRTIDNNTNDVLCKSTKKRYRSNYNVELESDRAKRAR